MDWKSPGRFPEKQNRCNWIQFHRPLPPVANAQWGRRMQPSFSFLLSGRVERDQAPSGHWRWIDFAIERSRLVFVIGLRRFPALRCRLSWRRDPIVPGREANQRRGCDPRLFATRALYRPLVWGEKPEQYIPACYPFLQHLKCALLSLLQIHRPRTEVWHRRRLTAATFLELLRKLTAGVEEAPASSRSGLRSYLE